MAELFKCPSCGAPLEVIHPTQPTVKCPYCNASVIVPMEMRGTGSRGAGVSPLNWSEQVADLAALGQLVRDGQKLEAVKRYRQMFGVGLKEAVDAVEKLETGEPVQIMQASSQAHSADPTLRAEIFRLLQVGNKIQAIKIYRDAYGGGLREAKDAVERFEAGGVLDKPLYSEAYPPVTDQPRPGRSKNAAGAVLLFSFLIFAAGCVLALVLFARSSSQNLFSGVLQPVLTEVAQATQAPAVIDPTMVAMITQAVGLRSTPQATEAPWAPLVLSFGAKGIGAGKFEDARSIALDADGNIYIGEYIGGRIHVFDSQGKLLTQWMVDARMPLRGMAAARDGTLYVVQSGQIQKYAGSSGQSLGQLTYPERGFDDVSVTVDGSLVAFMRQAQDSLVRFTPQGAVDLQLDQPLSSLTDDAERSGRVAVDGRGAIYILGDYSDAVFKFTPQGKFVNRFGSVGDEPGQLRAPMALALDSQGRIYVSDFKGIQVFDENGRYLNVIDVPGAVFGMVLDDNDRLYAVSNVQQVFVFEPGW